MSKPSILKRVRYRIARWRVLRQLLGPKVLGAVAAERPNAFFIEIGANDGQMMDPLRATILASRWRGVVVEPIPELFARLSRNYQVLADRVQPINAAIGARDGTMPFFYLRDLPGQPALPRWAHGLGSFRREVLLTHADRIIDLESRVATIEVPTLTWESFCARCQVAKVDVLMTDTEGYDGEIIAQLDLKRWRPALLIYEHHHFEKAALTQLDDRLRNAGYLMFREGLDTWCMDTHPKSGLSRPLLAAMPTRIRRSRYAIAV